MGSFLDICFPSCQSSCFVPPLVIHLRTLPYGTCTHTLAKMNLKVKASGRSKTHYGLEFFSDFWLQGAFLCMCIVSLILYSERNFFFFFASLCPCHDYSLEMFTRNKDWLFTLFLLSLPFWIASRAGCKFLNWSPPISYQEMQRGAGWLWIFSLEPIYLLPQDHQKTWNP